MYHMNPGNMFSKLSDETFLLFAIKYYNNPQCSDVKEFYYDLNKANNIKKQLTKYFITDEINERLFLNNIVMFFNVFEIDAACVMLLYKIPFECWSPLKTALNFLGYLKPNVISDIPEDYSLRVKLDRL